MDISILLPKKESLPSEKIGNKNIASSLLVKEKINPTLTFKIFEKYILNVDSEEAYSLSLLNDSSDNIYENEIIMQWPGINDIYNKGAYLVHTLFISTMHHYE